MLLIIVINKNQELSIHLFLLNCSFSYQNFTRKFLLLETFDSEFSYVEVWFTDQNSNPIEIKYNINITLVIN